MKRFIKRLAKIVAGDEPVAEEPKAQDKQIRASAEEVVDNAIPAFFEMMEDESPGSGAMVISTNDGGYVVIAKSWDRLCMMVDQCDEQMQLDFVEETGYYGGAIDA